MCYIYSPYVEMGISLTTDVLVAAVMLWILFQKKARCWLRCAAYLPLAFDRNCFFSGGTRGRRRGCWSHAASCIAQHLMWLLCRVTALLFTCNLRHRPAEGVLREEFLSRAKAALAHSQTNCAAVRQGGRETALRCR